MASYLTLARPHRLEIPRIKGSRFLASVAPVADPEAAQDLLAATRREFPDATHHCSAWRIDASLYKTGDDGEPGGTAGRPILQQIDARRLVRVAVVVTRWYGGTKLGAGGLVRAYGGAAGEALDAAGITEVIIKRTVIVEHPYDVSGEVQSVLNARKFTPDSASYEAVVRLTFSIREEDAAGFAAELVDRTAGVARVEVSEPDS